MRVLITPADKYGCVLVIVALNGWRRRIIAAWSVN